MSTTHYLLPEGHTRTKDGRWSPHRFEELCDACVHSHRPYCWECREQLHRQDDLFGYQAAWERAQDELIAEFQKCEVNR